MATYKLYFISKKTCKPTFIFRSDNSDDCFKVKEVYEKTDYFKKNFYKNQFTIISTPDGEDK